MKTINIEELEKWIENNSYNYNVEFPSIVTSQIICFLDMKKSEPEECCENCENWIESCLEFSEKFGMCPIEENKLGEYIFYDEFTDKLLFRKNHYCNHWKEKK